MNEKTKDFKKSLINLLKDYGILPKTEDPVATEEMISYEVVYEPNTKDAHGEWMSHDTVLDACENFNVNLKKGNVSPNLFHLKDTNLFTIEDTWIQKEFDVLVADTQEPIKAGTWIAKIQYNDPDLWALKKANVIGGLSIGGKGKINEETGEITEISFDGDEE